VEVLSASNTREEITIKFEAQLRGGAKEVITLGINARTEFHGSEGLRNTSLFGLNIELPDDLF
jgi:hypothetical protein